MKPLDIFEEMMGHFFLNVVLNPKHPFLVLLRHVPEAVVLQWTVGVGDTANFGIDLIPSKYRASIADNDTDTFHLNISDQ